ncbi:TPA: hypothetical protein ACH3X2_008442 [Trebouxia sp. C0005]
MVSICGQHRVQPGDTCFSVAAQYIVSYDDLLDVNKDSHIDFTALRPGMVLAIPPEQKPRTEYTVRPGDDLWKIAQTTGNPESAIIAQNPGTGPLHPGLRLQLHACPSFKVLVKAGGNTPLPAPWSEDESFQRVLKTQIHLLQPHGSAVFKYPCVERPQVECFVTVQQSDILATRLRTISSCKHSCTVTKCCL